MKRLAFVLAAALFALTACTPRRKLQLPQNPPTTPETTHRTDKQARCGGDRPTLYLQPPLCAGCCL